jgi:hypothetical protein
MPSSLDDNGAVSHVGPRPSHDPFDLGGDLVEADQVQ